MRSCFHETSNLTGLDLVLFSSEIDGVYFALFTTCFFAFLPLPLSSIFVCTSRYTPQCCFFVLFLFFCWAFFRGRRFGRWEVSKSKKWTKKEKMAVFACVRSSDFLLCSDEEKEIGGRNGGPVEWLACLGLECKMRYENLFFQIFVQCAVFFLDSCLEPPGYRFRGAWLGV